MTFRNYVPRKQLVELVSYHIFKLTFMFVEPFNTVSVSSALAASFYTTLHSTRALQYGAQSLRDHFQKLQGAFLIALYQPTLFFKFAYDFLSTSKKIVAPMGP